MLKILNLLFLASFMLVFNAVPGVAGDTIVFKYTLSEKFSKSTSLLGESSAQDFDQVKGAIQKACALWENATQKNIQFSLVEVQEDADIIFEGWSATGPKVSSQNGMICIDDYDGKHLFTEYMPKALGFTIFEDCNSACKYPETCDPASAAANHRARIFFHINNDTGPWFYETATNDVSFEAAQKDVTRVAAQELGHALGFCGYPDSVAQKCPDTPACGRRNASIMCQNQVYCYQKDQNGAIPLGGMDDPGDIGVRDLTLFDKKRIVNKYFPGTKMLFGQVQDADGNPIPNAVIATADENLTTRTDKYGRYTLWRMPPGTYSENAKNPETGQFIGETITITQTAPEVIIKDFNFLRRSQRIPINSRVVPSSGTPQDIYNLEATFPGIYPDHAASIRLYVDGKALHTFSTPPADEQPVNVFSYYSLSGLGLGSHTYELKASKNEEGWQPILNGSFRINRPTNTQFDIAVKPTHISVGNNNHTTFNAYLRNDNGRPLAGEIITFRTSFPGYFSPANGVVTTNAQGQAEITFTPTASGRATITAIPPYGRAISEVITNTSPIASISFAFRHRDGNSYEVTTQVRYTSGDRSAAGDTIKWRLHPAADLSWIKGPYKKLDQSGRARGIFSIGNVETTQAIITVIHIPTGLSGKSTFTPTRGEAVRIVPWKNLKKFAHQSEWSSNGFFGVTQKSGAGISMYRTSNWKRLWNKTTRSGKYGPFCFSSDGRQLVTSILNDENKITVIDVPSGRTDKSWRIAIDGEFREADKAFAWQGDYIYAIHDDNTIRKWSTSGNLETTFKHNAEIEELRFNPVNDSQFAAVDKYGTLQIWHTGSSSPVKTVQVESMPTGRLKCLAWSHDGTSLSVGSGVGDIGVIYTFDTASWSKSGFDLPGLGNVHSLDYNGDSSRLAIGHDKGFMVYHTNKQAIEYYDKGSVQHVRWGPKKSMLAADGQIYILGKQSFQFPEIRILTPQNQSSFMGDAVVVKGKIRGNQHIRQATISVNNTNPKTLSLAPDGSFAQTVPLTKNQNTMLIRAQDIQQNTSSATFTVNRFFDSIPPILTAAYVDANIDAQGKKFHLSVRVHDGESGVDSSKVTADVRSQNGRLLHTVTLYDDGNFGDKHAGDGVFETLWVSPEAIEGIFFIDFIAFDRTGNVGNLPDAAHFYAYNKPTISTPDLMPHFPSMSDAVTINSEITDTSGVKSAALLYSTTSGSSWKSISMSNTGSMYTGSIPAQTSNAVYYKIKAADVHGYSTESNTYAYRVRDNTRPLVIIEAPTIVSKMVTSEPSIQISGRTVDAGSAGLKNVTSNTGDPNLGTLENWRFNISLNKGSNRITIIAEDQNGKLGNDTIEIIQTLSPDAPEFSPAAPHDFENQLSVSIISPEMDAAIRYTIDNTEPDIASKIYSSPIIIKETTTIKARAYTADGVPSSVAVGTYILAPTEKAETKHRLTLQVAAFKDKKFADELTQELKAKGYLAYSIVGTSAENVTYYKVRVGSFAKRAEAENMIRKIKKENLDAIIVNTVINE